MDSDTFAELVSDALGSIPDEFLEGLENIQVHIEEWPAPEDLEDVGIPVKDRHHLLGLYHGVPLTERSSFYVALPDRISIYQRPIEAMTAGDPEAIKAQVRITVIHEIGHYYGMSDEQLRGLGW